MAFGKIKSKTTYNNEKKCLNKKIIKFILSLRTNLKKKGTLSISTTEGVVHLTCKSTNIRLGVHVY